MQICSPLAFCERCLICTCSKREIYQSPLFACTMKPAGGTAGFVLTPRTACPTGLIRATKAWRCQNHNPRSKAAGAVLESNIMRCTFKRFQRNPVYQTSPLIHISPVYTQSFQHGRFNQFSIRLPLSSVKCSEREWDAAC